MPTKWDCILCKRDGDGIYQDRWLRMELDFLPRVGDRLFFPEMNKAGDLVCVDRLIVQCTDEKVTNVAWVLVSHAYLGKDESIEPLNHLEK